MTSLATAFRLSGSCLLTPSTLPGSTRATRNQLLNASPVLLRTSCRSPPVLRLAGAGRRRKGRAVAQASSSSSSSVSVEEGVGDGEECEVVNGREVVLADDPNAEGCPGGYLVQPLKNNNGCGVLLLPDVKGHTNTDTRDFARRLACFGYNVFVADLFRGKGWEEGVYGDYDTWRAEHAPAVRVAADIDLSVEFLKSTLGEHEISCAPAPCIENMAMLGFCFGGGRVIETLARDTTPPQFRTAVSFYGTRVDPAFADTIQVPLLFITGDQDPLSPVATAKAVTDRVPGSSLRVYPGLAHAFAHHPSNADEDDAAEDAFMVAKHWLHQHLL